MANAAKRIHPTAIVSKTAIIGKRYRPLLTGQKFELQNNTCIGSSAYIGDYVIIGEGCEIGDQTVLDDFTKLEPGVVVGQRCLLIYAAHICSFAKIADDCIVGGFVGDSTIIDTGCRIFGKIIHKQDNPTPGWDDNESEEPAAQIGHSCFIGFQALVVGPIIISSHSYIAAGATVTKDVPSHTVVTGLNKHTPIAAWKGSLKDSTFLQE